MATPNDEIAGSTGQDGTLKEPIQAYDQKHGSYNPSHVQGKEPIMPEQPKSPVMPFKTLSGGK